MVRNRQGRQAAQVPRPRSVRGVALAIAVAALALLVLKPFCDLAFASAGKGGFASAAAMTSGHAIPVHTGPATPDSAMCCASVTGGSLINSAESQVPWMPDISLGVAFIVLAGLLPVAGSRNAAWSRFAAPPERSFYLRSARILR